MIWTAKELIEHLQTYKPNEQIVGQIWSKLDVEYHLDELQTSISEGDFHGLQESAAQEEIDKFQSDDFWYDHIHVIDNSTERETGFVNSEMFAAMLVTIEEQIEKRKAKDEV